MTPTISIRLFPSLHKISASSGSGKRYYSMLCHRIENKLLPCLEFFTIYRKTGFFCFKDIINQNNQTPHNDLIHELHIIIFQFLNKVQSQAQGQKIRTEQKSESSKGETITSFKRSCSTCALMASSQAATHNGTITPEKQSLLNVVKDLMIKSYLTLIVSASPSAKNLELPLPHVFTFDFK